MRFVLTLLIPMVVLAGRWCPPGSFDVPQQNECLHTESAPNTFNVASLICGYLGGGLVKVTNGFVNNLVAGQALATLGGQKAFIGIVKSGQNNWTYVDGSQLTYQNWQQGQPGQENGQCAVIDPVSLQWVTQDCKSSLSYFCTIPDIATPCPNGWTYFYDTESCYLVHQTSDPLYTYSSQRAEAECAKLGTHLVSIHSEKENSFVKRIIATDNADKQHCDVAEVAIGLTCSNAAFSWTDGSQIDYRDNASLCSSQNWVYGMINDPYCNTTQYQKWDEWQINQQFSRYVCKMAAH
ncbi:unnamed protein product, partial [Mesorhabditis spiculigera]